MEAIERKVKTALLEYFEPHELLFEKNADGRISGFIVSSKFEKKTDLARQKKIWGLLRKNLSKAEQTKVLGFLAYTPAEHEAYSQPILQA